MAEPSVCPVYHEDSITLPKVASVDKSADSAALSGALDTWKTAIKNNDITVLTQQDSKFPPITHAFMREWEKEGGLYRIDPKDVTAEAAASTLMQNALADQTPIYVIPSLGNDKTSAGTYTLEDGKKIILLNEGGHHWTEQYAKNQLFLSDRDIPRARRLGQILTTDDMVRHVQNMCYATTGSNSLTADIPSRLTPDVEERYKIMLNGIHDEAKNMGNPRVSLFITPNAEYAGDAGAALSSKEGHSYVFVALRTFLTALSSDANEKVFETLIGHELAHVKNHNTTPADEAKIRNISVSQPSAGAKAQRKEETLADLEGAGPVGAHNPEALANFFKQQMRNRHGTIGNDLGNIFIDAALGISVSTTSNIASDDAKLRQASHDDARLTDDHPTNWDRVTSLLDEAKRMKEYESSHSVISLKDKKAESEFVVRQVMRDMHGQWQLPVDDAEFLTTTPAEGKTETAEKAGAETSLSASQRKQLSAIKASVHPIHQTPVTIHEDVVTAPATHMNSPSSNLSVRRT